MREIRLVLVLTPRFLADLIRHVVAVRLRAAGYRLVVVAELGDRDDLAAQLAALDPDVVILGPGSAAAAFAGLAGFPAARVVRLSPTLAELAGPGDEEVAVLTPDSLAARVIAAARRI